MNDTQRNNTREKPAWHFGEQGWQEVAGHLLATDQMKDLHRFVQAERRGGKTVFPPEDRVFAAFEKTPFDQVRVVILGQDPYIQPGQACGLSFSVPDGIKPPPSLKNIFKEIAEDEGVARFDMPAHGNLENWAAQGVLLLNAVLTVEEGESGSHARRGWEIFTDEIIQILNDRKEKLIFLLWGGYAKKKGKLIDRERHHVLEAGHPSPLSVRYFRGCRHFSQVNCLLEERGEQPIDWQL